MADASDDFFKSFGGSGGHTRTTDGSRSGAPPKRNANASLSLSAGAASYRAATSAVAPPPPPRPTVSATTTTIQNGGGTAEAAPGVKSLAAPNVTSNATSNAPAVPKAADMKARPAMRTAASRPSRSAAAAASSAARPLSRTLQSSSAHAPNPSVTVPASETASSASSSGAYYGGSVAYKSATAASTATKPTATSVSANQSFPYYSGAPSASSAPAAPSPYGNYGAAPAPPAATAPVAYNYAATAARAPSPTYNYGQSAQSASAAPQVLNPYLLSSTTAPANAFSGTMDTNAAFSGPMDTSAQHSMFIPQQPATSKPSAQLSYQPYNATEFDDDPPLLEELGINVEHIVAKTRSVVLPFSRFKGTISDAAVIQDADLAGPIALGLLLGGELMLSGKLQFGYIYGFGLFGCVSMTLVLNFMSPTEAISVWTVTSILGYSLLPVNLLAAVKLLVVNLGNLQLLGQFLGFLTVVWCTIASTRLMEQGCGMRDQRYLIAYPIGLLYTAFVMITIF